MTGRLKSIDVAKGIVICLMVLGHSSLPVWLSNWIWSFHMPFFFFVSGLLSSWRKGLKEFYIGKIKMLLLPFLLYSCINLLLYPFYGEKTWGDFIVYTLIHGWGGYALWFIPILCFSLLICRLIKNKILINVFFIMFFSVLACLFDIYKIEYPWAISTIPVACVYILLVRIFSSQIIQYANSEYSIIDTVLVFGGLCITLFVSHYYRLDLASNDILPFFPLMMTSVLGSIMILSFSKFILKSKCISNIWSLIGENSIVILAFSQCIIGIINYYCDLNPIIKYLSMSLILFLIIKLRMFLKAKSIYVYI